MLPMPKPTLKPAVAAAARVRRGYFECRYGQLHLHNAMPPGGGFEEGTPLLCLHDCPGSGRDFTPFLALAGRERSVYAPDLPGFGESDGPLTRPSLADYVGAVGDFLDAMRLRKLDVLGVRAGALLAAELTITRAAQVGRVVMVSVPLPLSAASHAGGTAPERPALERWVHEAVTEGAVRERLARLSQKLLVLRPKDDLWEGTAHVRDVLPAARVMDLELSGSELLAHSPGRLFDAVRDFLRG
jgi:pimeloyl-ACP methyl ester carboxylesterase